MTGSDEVFVAKNASGLTIAVDLLPHLELERQRLGDRLDDEVAVGEVAVVGRALDPPEDRVGVLLAGLALLDRPRELLLILPMPFSSVASSTSRRTTS